MQGGTLYGTPGEISTPPLPKPRFVLTDTVGAPFDFWQKARARQRELTSHNPQGASSPIFVAAAAGQRDAIQRQLGVGYYHHAD